MNVSNSPVSIFPSIIIARNEPEPATNGRISAAVACQVCVRTTTRQKTPINNFCVIALLSLCGAENWRPTGPHSGLNWSTLLCRIRLSSNFAYSLALASLKRMVQISGMLTLVGGRCGIAPDLILSIFRFLRGALVRNANLATRRTERNRRFHTAAFSWAQTHASSCVREGVTCARPI